MNERKLWATQVGSYGWAKQAAQDAADYAQGVRRTAALTGKTEAQVRRMVSDIRRNAGITWRAALNKIEHQHLVNAPGQDWISRQLEMPNHPQDRRTVVVLGKLYHWATVHGVLQLRTGATPW
jgi:hypothetical protein